MAGGGALGCGHAGDGNVHFGIFCKDADKRERLLTDIFAYAIELGGAISGEHGLGRTKAKYHQDLEDPAKIEAGLAELAFRLHPDVQVVANQQEAANWALAWLQSHDGWLLIQLGNDGQADELAGWSASSGLGFEKIETRGYERGVLLLLERRG